jgi:hypothetical protein
MADRMVAQMVYKLAAAMAAMSAVGMDDWMAAKLVAWKVGLMDEQSAVMMADVTVGTMVDMSVVE